VATATVMTIMALSADAIIGNSKAVERGIHPQPAVVELLGGHHWTVPHSALHLAT
jgi:hypothetical protein